MAGLSPRTLRIARAIAATMFDPGTGTPVPEARLDWMQTELADYARCSGPRTSTGVTVILTLLQLLPLFVIGKLARFSSMGLEDRLRYLRRIETHGLFAPLLATTKIVLCLIYYEHPDVLREAGVVADCLHPEAT